MHLVRLVVSRGDGAPAEQRLLACYRFLEYRAAALVRSPDTESLQANGRSLLALLDSARPEWHEAAVVSDLWH
jgi:hypothetical protein